MKLLLIIVTIAVSLVNVACDSGSSLQGISGESLVQVKNKGSVKMKFAEVGDHVLVDDNKYEPIYSFHHSEAPTDYIQILTNTARLEVTRDQMVFVQGNHAIPALSVQVGDTVLIPGGFSVVKATATLVRDGAYAPLTPSGSMFVNGIKVSGFVSSSPSSTEAVVKVAGIPFTHQWIAYTLELPHRFWCYNLRGSCERGAWLSSWGRWFSEQTASLQVILAVPLLLLLSALVLMKMLATYRLTIVSFVLLRRALPYSIRIKQIYS